MHNHHTRTHTHTLTHSHTHTLTHSHTHTLTHSHTHTLTHSHTHTLTHSHTHTLTHSHTHTLTHSHTHTLTHSHTHTLTHKRADLSHIIYNALRHIFQPHLNVYEKENAFTNSPDYVHIHIFETHQNRSNELTDLLVTYYIITIINSAFITSVILPICLQ